MSDNKQSDNKIIFLEMEDELFGLKDYLPLNVNNVYFDKMFENLLVVKDSAFYNNAVIGLTHFYTYVLHCFLLQLYRFKGERELLKCLQTTTECLNSRDGKFAINLEDRFDIFSFRAKEKEAFDYFLHVLNLCKGSHLCKRNQQIFDMRNIVAHLSLEVIDKTEFDNFVELIKLNLEEISSKIYKYAKTAIIEDLKEAIKDDRIDESFYLPIIEEINQINHISYNFYRLFLRNNTFDNIQPNTPLFYINKYIEEELKFSYDE